MILCVWVGLNTIKISPGATTIFIGDWVRSWRRQLEVLAVRSWEGGREKFCSLFHFAPSPIQALAVPLLISIKEFTTSSLSRKISSLKNKHELPEYFSLLLTFCWHGEELAPFRAAIIHNFLAGADGADRPIHNGWVSLQITTTLLSVIQFLTVPSLFHYKHDTEL